MVFYISFLYYYACLTTNFPKIFCWNAWYSDIHCGPESYELKLLEKLVIKHGITTSLDGRLCVQILPYVYFFNLLSPKRGYLLSPHVSSKEATSKGGSLSAWFTHTNMCKAKGGYKWGRVFECMIYIMSPNPKSSSF